MVKAASFQCPKAFNSSLPLSFLHLILPLSFSLRDDLPSEPKLSDHEDATSEAPPTPSEHSEPSTPLTLPPPEEGTPRPATPPPEDPSKPFWPSVNDLNTRLRRVVTSYQRSFKKEELKLLQKAKVCEVVLPSF